MRSRLERIAIDLLDRNLPRFAALRSAGTAACTGVGVDVDWIRGRSESSPLPSARRLFSAVAVLIF